MRAIRLNKPLSNRSDSSISSDSSQEALLSESFKMIHRTDSNQTKKDAFTEDSQGESARIQVRTILSAARQSHESELTLDDIFDENKSAKENKSLMMSYELDRMQMGKYQWLVFGLCGLGYFIDLMWAQALGLIAVPLKNEPSFGADGMFYHSREYRLSIDLLNQ